jgi:predicted aspartyl protease
VPVTVNGSGPYDFMLDTGSTITSVDRELGQELALQPRGQGVVMTLTERTPASLAVARRVAIGPVTEQNVEVMIRDLSGLRHIAPTARGVLGQNALNHADFLLDYRHKLMQFDTAGELARSLKGHHVPLRRELVEGNPRYANLAVQANVNDNGAHPVDVLLDSGAASMVLFGGVGNDALDRPQGLVTDTAGRQLVSSVRNIQVVIDGNSREVATNVLASRAAGKDIGGLLPTNIFGRIYISNSGGFAMFEPKLKKPMPLDHMIASMAPQAAPDR